MYLNKATIVGNLTRDPEIKSLPSGMKVANFSIATNRVWKDSSGQKQEAADYHNIVVFGRQAESSVEFLKKGSQALVEGRLQTSTWDDATSGKKMYKTEIIAERVQFGQRPQAGAAGSKEDFPVSADKKDKDDGGGESIAYPEEDINPEDIPF